MAKHWPVKPKSKVTVVSAGVCHLCCAVLCCLCCAVLCCAVLCCATLPCALLYTVLGDMAVFNFLASPVHPDGTLILSPHAYPTVQWTSRKAASAELSNSLWQSNCCLYAVSCLHAAYKAGACIWHPQLTLALAADPSGAADIVLQACWRLCLAFETCLLTVEIDETYDLSPIAFTNFVSTDLIL